MGKHLHVIIKLKYVLRALIKHEDVVHLGKELIVKGLSKSLGTIHNNGVNKPGTITIYQWIYRFIAYGTLGLGRMSKKNGKKQITADDFTKDELLSALHLMEELIKDEGITVTKEKLEKIKKRIEQNASSLQKLYKGFVSWNKIIILFGIANSSFYYKSHPKTIDEKITKRVIEAFVQSKSTYGSRRILAEIKASDPDLKIGRKLVRKIMYLNNLKSIIKTRHRRHDPKNTDYECNDLIQRDFVADKPMTKLFTDTTYIPSPHAKQGFFYLSAYIDGYNNAALAPALSESNDTKLAMKSIRQLELNENSIIHSDHGSMYTSNKFSEFIVNHGAKQSMGRVGKSLDNRPIEFFWSNIKDEFIDKIPYDERTYKRVWEAIIEYINWYNKYRRQSCLMQLAPFMMANSIIKYY